MASKESKNQKPTGSDKPKNQQLIQMLSFRIVPAYFKEIEKVADKKSITVSKLIRGYIKDGMHRDEDFTKDDKGFNIG
jgi:hypothetical protein